MSLEFAITYFDVCYTLLRTITCTESLLVLLFLTEIQSDFLFLIWMKSLAVGVIILAGTKVRNFSKFNGIFLGVIKVCVSRLMDSSLIDRQKERKETAAWSRFD